MDRDMWQEWGTCGRVWWHVAGNGSMWQGWWQGVGECGRGGAYGRGVRPMTWMGTCHGGMWQGVGACGRVWGHVAGCGGVWQGVGECSRGGDRV